jgi:glycosyltransferase involved in cell wall biosynthesis
VRVLCVIPAHDEAASIGGVVAALRAEGFPVLAVDDGSLDATAERAAAAGASVLRLERNRGKGAALREGFARASAEGYDAVIALDADGQHDPRDAPKLVRAAERRRLDVAIGCRMHAPGPMPAVRYWTNVLMSLMITCAAGAAVRDSQCGFRLVRARVLRAVRLSEEAFGIESELILKAGKKGFRVGEVDIRTIYGGQRSRIRIWRDTLRFFRLWVENL